jgi:uncharacterized membrane protein
MRWFRHAWAELLGVQKAFPVAVRNSIELEITAVEAGYRGEICFAVEAALSLEQLWRRTTARQRAMECFATLGVWDTAANNGVLIYVLLADRSVEIVADRGIAAQVGDEQWRVLCASVEAQYRNGAFGTGSRHVIRGVAEHMAKHFPNEAAGRNELPNQPILL